MFGPQRDPASLSFEMILANELGPIPGTVYEDFRITKIDDGQAKLTVTVSKIIPMTRLAEMRAELRKWKA